MRHLYDGPESFRDTGVVEIHGDAAVLKLSTGHSPAAGGRPSLQGTATAVYVFPTAEQTPIACDAA